MELCEHGEDHLNDEAEVSDAEPGHLAIPHRGGDVLGRLVQLLLVLLLLCVVPSVALVLLPKVFYVFISESSCT